MFRFKTDLTKDLACVLILLHFSYSYISAQSKAHELSKFAIIDPAYSSKEMHPESDINKKGTAWIYGASELECWRLQLLQQQKDSAKLNVGYPGVFHEAYNTGSFRLRLTDPQEKGSISFSAVGQGKLYINDLFIGSFQDSDSSHSITLKKSIKINLIQFDMDTRDEPIALLIDIRELSTSLDSWEWKPKNGDWEPAYNFPQNFLKLPPHKLEDPTIVLKPEGVKDNLYDFGREVYGYLIINNNDRPEISVGESEKEALDVYNKVREQSAELVNISDGVWKSKYPVAFRYLFIENRQIPDIACQAIYYPASYKGAFACSDSALTQIWMNSAYTLRLCMHDFFLDGIKRDRLPWAGDLAMSLLVNACTFSGQEPVRRSLVALGRAGIKEKDINGIIDYSLWWIIAQDLYQLYFEDPLHLTREWSRIRETLNDLSARCDTNGFLMPTKDNWLFIDWVDQEKWTALQILWWWAQNSGAKLAQRAGDSITANHWINSAGSLKTNLLKVAWSAEDQIWLSKNDSVSENTRHPNFLSVVSGMTTSDQYVGIKKLLENSSIKPVGTPYMAGFEVMALAQIGNTDYMLNHVNDYWGGMLNMGASTFWEAYDPNETFEERYSFYGRPYGKSLCHAWSAGPAAFLPSGLFGLKPTADGWKRFTLDPNTGNLEWASVCVPTKYGNITVDIENSEIQISIPEGTTLEWKGKEIKGRRIMKDRL
jgi:hypothetical protein